VLIVIHDSSTLNGQQLLIGSRGAVEMWWTSWGNVCLSERTTGQTKKKSAGLKGFIFWSDYLRTDYRTLTDLLSDPRQPLSVILSVNWVDNMQQCTQLTNMHLDRSIQQHESSCNCMMYVMIVYIHSTDFTSSISCFRRKFKACSRFGFPRCSMSCKHCWFNFPRAWVVQN
jgi:hypothetical protein